MPSGTLRARASHDADPPRVPHRALGRAAGPQAGATLPVGVPEDQWHLGAIGISHEDAIALLDAEGDAEDEAGGERA